MAVIILAILLTISTSFNVLILLGTIGLIDDNDRLEGLNEGLRIENERLKRNMDIFKGRDHDN